MKNFSLLPEGKVKAELKQQHIKSWIFHNGKALLHIRGPLLFPKEMRARMQGRSRGDPRTLLTLCSIELFSDSLRGTQLAALLGFRGAQSQGRGCGALLEFWQTQQSLISLNTASLGLEKNSRITECHQLQPLSVPLPRGTQNCHSTRGASAGPALRF